MDFNSVRERRVKPISILELIIRTVQPIDALSTYLYATRLVGI